MPDPSTTTPAPDGDAVERAARALHDEMRSNEVPWEFHHESYRAIRRDQARAALAAAREPGCVPIYDPADGEDDQNGCTTHAGPWPCATREPVTPYDREVCEHCPDGHSDPTTRPWAAFVASERDGDGQPTHLHVAPTAGQHVAESDAQWVRDLLNTARPSVSTVTAEQVRQAARAADGAEWGSLPWVHTFLAALGIEVTPCAATFEDHYLRGGQTSAEWARGEAVPTVTAKQRARLIALTYASDDGTEYEHDHDEQDGGAPDCPACWAGAIRAALGIEVQP